MCDSKAAKSKRAAAGIVGFMILLILLLSVSYIIVESDHDCTGEDCPTCVFLQQCMYRIHGVNGEIAVVLSTLIPIIFILFFESSIVIGFSLKTLVSRKVRMNN